MSTKLDASPPIFPYPTADQIEDIFAKVETPEELGNLRELFSPSFHGEVMGHDHSFVGKHHGGDSWIEQLGSILSSLDHEKTFKLEIVQVIGGGNSPWASMEAKATAKTKTGKDYDNNFVWVMRFNGEGKISKVRAYYDSAHLEELAKEMKAGQ